jgi:hypothetical protein
MNSSGALCSSESAPLLSSSDLALETELESLSLAANDTCRRPQHLEVMPLNKAGAPHEDILLLIFSYLVPSTADCGRDVSYYLRLVAFAFSRVCRTWRYVALNAPSLWSQPLMHNTEATLVMLERSANVPLKVVMDLWCYPGGRPGGSTALAVRSMFACMNRISHLDVTATKDAVLAHGLPAALSVPAPLLREIRLSSYMASFDAVEKFAGTVVESAPRLSSLILGRIKAPWNSKPVRHLHSFSVRLHEYHSWHDESSLDELLLGLRNLPNIECLDLYLPVDKRSLDHFPSRKSISLPRLRELSIMDDMRISVAVLQCLVAPSLVRSNIGDALSCREGSRRVDVVDQLCMGLFRLSAGLRSWGADATRRLHIQVDKSGQLRIALKQPATSGLALGPEPELAIAFADLSPQERSMILSRFVHLVPAETLSHLTLEDRTIADPDWEGISLTVFRSFAKLVRIDIGEGVFSHFTNVWRDASECSNPFPALEELHLRTCCIVLVHRPRDASLELSSDFY